MNQGGGPHELQVEYQGAVTGKICTKDRGPVAGIRASSAAQCRGPEIITGRRAASCVGSWEVHARSPLRRGLETPWSERARRSIVTVAAPTPCAGWPAPSAQALNAST